MIPLHRCRVVLARMVVVIGLGLSPAVLQLCADPVDWSFTPVIKNGQEGFTFIDDAAVGVNGSVVVLADRNNVEGVHLFAGGTVTTIAQINQPLPATLGTVSGFPSVGSTGRPRFAIDGAGRVIFLATVTGGTLPASTALRAFRWDKGVITHLLPDNGFVHLLDTMSDDGRWLAERLTGSGLPQFREYVVTDGVTTFASFNFTNARSGCSVYSMEPGHVISPTSMLMVDGTLAQRALSGGQCDRFNSTEEWAVRIEGPAGRTVATGIRTTVSSTTTSTGQSGAVRPHNFVASANGGVAFMQQNLDPTPRVNRGSFELFISDEGGTRSILKTNREGEARILGKVMHLDPFGRVSFSAFLSSGGNEFFSGPDLARDRVIGRGDRLFGEEADSISPVQVVGGGNTFQDSRVFLFFYRLRDAAQTFGVAVAQKERKPVIFLHGIAGSVLKAGSDQIWPSVFGSDVEDLALSPASPSATAVDVVRRFAGTDFYGPFLAGMVSDRGYVEYDLEEDRRRLTSDHMLSVAGAKPSLFTFPYDWRADNATHTATLRQYIQKIRQLHNNSKVNLIAHSMGGLVVRRYLLDYGTDDIDKVITVGSPLLGAVKPIYLMHSGDFYDNALDTVNSGTMKAALATMPGLQQLLPAPTFLANSPPVFGEAGIDLDRDGFAVGDYTASQLNDTLRTLVAPTPSPMETNRTFHNFNGGRQDNWSGDVPGAVKFLHFVGIQQVDSTIVKVNATPYLTGLFAGTLPLLQRTRFVPVNGEGDGTVPILSSRRMPGLLAPGAIVREIREPLAGITSNQQPAGQAAEHTLLMSNLEVWAGIDEFLSTGTLSSPSPAAAPVGPPEPMDAQALPGRRRGVNVIGAGYLGIRDLSGNTNAKIGDVAASRVPGVDAYYGGTDPWVDFTLGTDMHIILNGDPSTEPLDILVTDFDGSGAAIKTQRYRFMPDGHAWQMVLPPNTDPELRLDLNDNQDFADGETVAATFIREGASVDTTPPTVTLILESGGDTIVATLGGSDGSQPAPSVRHSLDEGAVLNYITPLIFPRIGSHSLKAFAEDSVGNTSSLIETTINPAMTIGGAASVTIDIEWPVADGYVLEEATSLDGPWPTSTATVIQSGFVNKASIPIGDKPKRFFRLRAIPVER